jgi:2-keto-4-pentenoate hydratase
MHVFEKAAATIREAYASATPCAPLREQFPELSGDDAYKVQDINTRLWEAAGRRIVGKKIGLTSQAVQQQLGVMQPDFGVLFDDMAFGDGDTVSLSKIIQPRIEAEVALVLGRDLDMERPTYADLIRAIDFALPAFEIVGSRIANWDIRFIDTVADNASSGAFVLGGTPRKVTELNLRGATMQMTRGDEVVSKGSGAACMGHPFNAAVWLAAKMTELERPLSAGDIILTGALGPMVPVTPGSRFEAVIEGLGSVTIGFTDN